MARSKGDGAIYRHKGSGRWCCEIVVAGKRKSFYGQTRAEVKEKRDAFKEALHRGTLIEPTKETVRSFMQRWMEHYVKGKVRDKTYSSYSDYVEPYIIGHLRDLRLTELTTAKIQEFYAYLLVDGRIHNREKLGSGLSARTVRYCHTLLQAALDKAVDERLIAENPAKKAVPPTDNRDEARVLSLEEHARYWRAIQEDKDYLVWLLYLDTGMRRGELLGLKWKWVDLKTGIIRVREALNVIDGVPTMTEVKSKTSRRDIAIRAEIVALIRQHKAEQNRQKLLLGKDYLDSGLVFCQPNGVRYDPNRFTRRQKKLTQSIGLDGVTIHTLRHTHATRLMERNMSLKELAEHLGHGSVEVTGDLYSHVVPERRRRVADLQAEIDSEVMAGF